MIRVDVQEVANATGKEYLIWLRVPAAGGDGMLLGVSESLLAAQTIAGALTLALPDAELHLSPSVTHGN